MSKKTLKYQEELERNTAKIAALKTRNGELERKIMEEEWHEIRAMMRSGNITMDGLATLIQGRNVTDGIPLPASQPSSDDDDAWMDEPVKTEASKQEDDYDDYE